MSTLLLTIGPALVGIVALLSNTIRTIIATIFRRPNRASIIVRNRDGVLLSFDLDSKNTDLSHAEIEALVADLRRTENTSESATTNPVDKGEVRDD